MNADPLAPSENLRFSALRCFPLTENSRFPTLSRSNPSSTKAKMTPYGRHFFFSGRGGIRTLGTISCTLAFQASTLSRSATLPFRSRGARISLADFSNSDKLECLLLGSPPMKDDYLIANSKLSGFLSIIHESLIKAI